MINNQLLFFFLSQTKTKEQRRATHSASEKKRRESIKDGFNDLRRRIPSCPSHSSKTVILRKGIEERIFYQKRKKKKTNYSSKTKKQPNILIILFNKKLAQPIYLKDKSLFYFLTQIDFFGIIKNNYKT